MKVAICGKLPDKYKAPFQDEGWQIWFCNWHEDYKKIPRYDLWFDIHEKPTKALLDIIPKENLILRQDYPIEYVQQLMHGNYLNNSMCYMLAYALLQKADTVKFYGCSFLDDKEKRTKQKQALREMAMFCRGLGMSVSADDKTLFEDYPLYK